MSCLSALGRLSIACLCLGAPTLQAAETLNKLGMALVDIPAGNFQMGSCKVSAAMRDENTRRALANQAPLSVDCSLDADASDSETPQHAVNIAGFQLGKSEVTLGQYKAFLSAVGRSDLKNAEFMKHNQHGDNAPVVQVSWEDTQAFIAWLNKTDGGGYRLPSEAEWEYACRAGASSRYCGGNTLSPLAWYRDNSDKAPHASGGKLPNAWGLHEMSGNVWEWVEDCWHASYEGAPSNGSAWVTGGSCRYRGVRGGAWVSSENSLRAAGRSYDLAPGFRFAGVGFRLARTPLITPAANK